jgi:ribosomal protein S20
LRKYRELSAEERAGSYPEIQSILDKAVGKRFIPKNRAARLKSRLRP